MMSVDGIDAGSAAGRAADRAARSPITAGGWTLARQSLDKPVRIDQILAIEDQSWNAALDAVEVAVGALHGAVCLCPGDGSDDGCNAPNFYLDTTAAIASLRISHD